MRPLKRVVFDYNQKVFKDLHITVEIGEMGSYIEFVLPHEEDIGIARRTQAMSRKLKYDLEEVDEQE